VTRSRLAVQHEISVGLLDAGEINEVQPLPEHVIAVSFETRNDGERAAELLEESVTPLPVNIRRKELSLRERHASEEREEDPKPVHVPRPPGKECKTTSNEGAK